MLLLVRLQNIVSLNDVEGGENPPDFVFHYEGGIIGVEHTDLNPKIFEFNPLERGGHRLRDKFESFEKEIAQQSSVNAEFDWGKYTLRESLAAFAAQVEKKKKRAVTDRWDEKQNKMKVAWYRQFSERWLLIHIADGSPFGEIVAHEQNIQVKTGRGTEPDYLAKVTHCIHEICQGKFPFDYVIPFWGENFLAFPTHSANPHQLPVPSEEVLKRGASIPDNLLDQKRGGKTIIQKRHINFFPPEGTV